MDDMNYYQALTLRRRWLQVSDIAMAYAMVSIAVAMVLNSLWPLVLATLAIAVQVLLLLAAVGLGKRIKSGDFDKSDQAS